MKRLFQILFVMAVALTLVSCNKTNNDDEGDVKLSVAVNFDGKRFISYNQNDPYNALDGKTYTKGDLSPTWSEIGKNLGIEFYDKGFELGAKNTDSQYQDAKTNGFKDIDLINSTGVNITADRQHFVDLKPYIDSGKMPNLKKFLESQDTFIPYLTASDGGIYYTPYLDGNEETELGFLMRIDWTQKLLDTPKITGDSSLPADFTGLDSVTPFFAENTFKDGKTVKVATATGTRNVVKKHNGNIITTLKSIANPTGEKYLSAFRTYMQAVYGDQGYAKLSDVFVGTDAAYDVDELTALMAVVKANPQLLRNESTVTVYFPREAKGSRIRNYFRGLEMYGVRGAVSKNNWLYLGEDGKLVDARKEESTIGAINKLNDLYTDGLLMQDFETPANQNHRDVLLKSNNGFLMYDYNATSTAQNIIDDAVKIDQNYRFETILPPVNNWKGDGTFFHFTESVRTLKNEAWGITKEASKDPKKLEKAIQLVDYLYDEEEGADLHLFGPKEWRHATETVTYKGEQIPKFSEGAMNEMKTIGGGNMINYLRDYVGATLPVGHVRSLGVELQTLSAHGESGYNRVRRAVDAGVLKLIGLEDTENRWYTPVPNVFALTTAQENELKESKDAFDKYWGDGELYKIAKTGLRGDSLIAYNNLFKYNNEDWYGDYIKYYQAALDKILK